ncbi:DUF4136 domain-containing protein [Desulfopila sp. IMCC35008]|uniref:DUF4136 domain-containing protein n=1 Tax=Desulfopila sp. IMCC35008 TaxID=2653858 RepID=UPI0013D1D7B1|nr:DUF4136 domain-containing protein [Desulfopila sp. IMCC35008]
MKRTGPAVVIMVILLLFMTGCGTVRVSQDYRPGSDFASFKSFSWQQVEVPHSEDARETNPLLHERFHAAIDRELVSRGIVPGQPGDLLVSYGYTIQTRFEQVPLDTHVGFGYGRYSRYGVVGFDSGTSFEQYDVGTLVIDLTESGTGRLLWRGTGVERLPDYPTPEKNIALVNKLVGAILGQFPPTP